MIVRTMTLYLTSIFNGKRVGEMTISEIEDMAKKYYKEKGCEHLYVACEDNRKYDLHYYKGKLVR